MLWSERPPYARKIHTFYSYLLVLDKKKQLSYKLVSESRIYVYFHRFDWQGWKENENYKSISNRTKKKTIESIDYTLNSLNDSMTWFSDFSNIIQKEMNTAFKDFDISDPQTSKVSIQLVQLYKDVLNVLSGLPLNLENTYHLIHELETEDMGINPMSNFSKMLKESEEKFKELENDLPTENE